MEIIGRGFVARNLAPIAERHPDVVVFAAGVSSSTSASYQEFAREAALLYRTIDDCARRGRRLIYFSTASPNLYGGELVYGRESGPVYPSSPYACHKLAMETVLARSSISYLALRITHLIGAHQPAHQVPHVIVAQVRSGAVRLFRGVCRDFLAVRDLGTIIDQLAGSGADREVVNVATGVAVPIDTIVDHLEERMGISTTREYVYRPEPPLTICIDRLRALVPAVAGMGFDRQYYQRVLDDFLTVSLAGTPAG